ncbi:MAG TPA: HEAT repeat domain-containing protein [Vicinamibacterales bacterium]|nr:HEAT repeat domain-containing protein [Vicinamibacterales bacterium]
MKTIILTVAALVIALPAGAQPQVTNGAVQPWTLGGGFTRATLDTLAAKSATAWVGYAVAALDGDRRSCCWNGDSAGCCQACPLEPGGSSGTTFSGINRSGVVSLESQPLHVLIRLDSGRVDRIRVFSHDCALDAGGLTVRWRPNVSPAESVTVLGSFLTAASSNRLADGALVALAMHREPAALERLLTAAKDGATTRLRGQALFWLAQRAGDKAAGAISDAIANDPETDVKKRAVFALSQLPKDEGVPMLIQVARTNTNPAVRKQAMFWLGQTRDPRAVKFFEEILFK